MDGNAGGILILEKYWIFYKKSYSQNIETTKGAQCLTSKYLENILEILIHKIYSMSCQDR